MADVNEREMIESWLPVGFRFKPTDEELVVEYLIRKIKKLELPFNRIREVELYKYATPEKLTENYELIRESEWYFFSPRDKKYPNGGRPKRSTPGGYWQSSITQDIHSNGRIVGRKTILNFYKGPPRDGKRTDWLMHEYTVKDSTSTSLDKNRLDDCILCKVYKKATSKNKSSSSNAGNKVGNRKESSSSNAGDEGGNKKEPSSSNTGNDQMSNYQLQQQPVHQQNQGINLPFDLGWFMQENNTMIPDHNYANNQLLQEPVHQQNQGFRLSSDRERSTIQLDINNMLQQQPLHQQINRGNMTAQHDDANNQLQQQKNISSAPPLDRRFDGDETFNSCDDLVHSQVHQQYQSIWDCGDCNLFWA